MNSELKPRLLKLGTCQKYKGNQEKTKNKTQDAVVSFFS